MAKEVQNTVNYYFCDVCHYCFEAESLPDRCPDCGKTVYQNGAAIRPATQKKCRIFCGPGVRKGNKPTDCLLWYLWRGVFFLTGTDEHGQKIERRRGVLFLAQTYKWANMNKWTNEQMNKWTNEQMNRDIPTWWMAQWSWTKIHPTTTAKGDVSCLQCKAVRRNLQDLKRITAREYFIRCLSGTCKDPDPLCLYAWI